MDYAYTFGVPTTLYLNVTNRCTNHCCFCVRHFTTGLGSGTLRGRPEPSLEDLLEAVAAHGGCDGRDEVVWCGFGEPTFRLDLILEASPRFRKAGARVRLNTNGHGCLINGRDVLPDLGRVLDVVSVSLNAPTWERYLELCRPDLGSIDVSDPRAAWGAMLDFLTRCPEHVETVRASVVGHCLDAAEVRASRALVTSLGCSELVIR